MKRFNCLICLIILAALPLAQASYAQSSSAQGSGDYRLRQQNLTKLSGIFGELHHIRRICEPRIEADIWRNRMKKMVELEGPSDTHHVQLVEAFNNGYKSAQRKYNFCNRDAEDYAASRAGDGGLIVNQLTAPLYKSLAESDASLPLVWRGNDQPQ